MGGHGPPQTGKRKAHLSDAWKHENYEREGERQTDRQKEGGRERKRGKERGCQIGLTHAVLEMHFLESKCIAHVLF